MKSLYDRVMPLGVHVPKNSSVGNHNSCDPDELLHSFCKPIDETVHSEVLQYDDDTFIEDVEK